MQILNHKQSTNRELEPNPIPTFKTTKASHTNFIRGILKFTVTINGAWSFITVAVIVVVERFYESISLHYKSKNAVLWRSITKTS